MAEENPQSSPESPNQGKGKAFFDRADEVAETANWDFAIEMYIEGIRREPENMERGHQRLREVSLRRKQTGGKGPGMMESLKRRPGKDKVENLANAAYLLAKDPGNEQYMQGVLKAAKDLELTELMKWACDLMLESQKQASKKNKNILLLLTQTYNDMAEFALAVQACRMALELSPNDPALQASLKEMETNYTIKKGRYDEEGSFTKSVKDLEGQKKLIQKDRLVQSKDFLSEQLEEAKQEYEQSPTVPGKINAFVDALLKFEDDAYENQAIDVLAKAHKDTGAYQFRARAGDIKIKQMTRRYRTLLEQGDKATAQEQARKQLAFELEEYRDRAQNYPTDLNIKYELGRRLLLAGQLDDAIAALQQAQREPRRAVAALTLLAQAFIRKEWFREGKDTLLRALDEHEMSETREKEIRYLLGDVLERMEEFDAASEQFSQVAQMDYNYKDVRDRLDKLRKQEK